MGKIRETFRLVAEERIAAPAEAVLGPEPPETDHDAVAQEMPYIEIGPRREVDGSPDVMACPATLKRPLPQPHNVLFRTLPALPRLAEVPRRARFAPELVAYHAPGQPASAQYADLLATLVEAARGRSGNPANVYLFTAIRSGIGATTVLLNLAITAARKDTRVLVVDANFRRPAIADRVGLEIAPGLIEVLTGAVPLPSAIRPTAQENLFILSSGAPAAVWADRDSLGELFGLLARQADLVLVDGPAWEGRGAASGLAVTSGAAFLVVPGSEADAAAVSELVATLPGQGIPLAGCILTAA
jgi:Mrp family chromosome partitioning ATPase